MKIGLEFLQVYTNFHKINNLEHQYFHTLRNLAVPLFFQNYFRKILLCFIIFSYLNSKIIPDSKSITSTEPILIPLLSTENLELLIHGAQYSRIRKTNIICNNELAQKYLDVCVHPNYYETIKERINCSKCYKCLRTCATLDYYNCLDKFEAVFDIELYKKHKKEYLENLEMTNPYDRELKGRYYFEDELYLDIKYNLTFEDLNNNELSKNNDNNIEIQNEENNEEIQNKENNEEIQNNKNNEQVESDESKNSNNSIENNNEINIDLYLKNNKPENNSIDIEINTKKSDENKIENNKEFSENKIENNTNKPDENNAKVSYQKELKEKYISSKDNKKNNKKIIGDKIVREENIYNDNNSFQEYMMKTASENTNNLEIAEDNNNNNNLLSEKNNVKFKLNINFEGKKDISQNNIDKTDKNYRIWWAFKKDWELLVKANQIRAIKDVVVKKNKDIHSSKLNDNEKILYKQGKLFRLEKEQNDELYYRIFI